MWRSWHAMGVELPVEEEVKDVELPTEQEVPGVELPV